MTAKERLKEKLMKGWGSPIVARRQAATFSGDLVRPGFLANCDSRGCGPAGRFRIGKNTAYYAEDLAEWIAGRLVEAE